jgi:hypothetical protein
MVAFVLPRAVEHESTALLHPTETEPKEEKQKPKKKNKVKMKKKKVLVVNF